MKCRCCVSAESYDLRLSFQLTLSQVKSSSNRILKLGPECKPKCCFEESKWQDGEAGKMSSQSEFLKLLHPGAGMGKCDSTLCCTGYTSLYPICTYFLASMERQVLSSVHKLEEHTAGGSAELASRPVSKHLQWF